MKKFLRIIIFIASILLLPTQPIFAESAWDTNGSNTGSSSTASSSTADTKTLYYDDAIFEYYLNKDTDGVSKMHVKETITAIFPQTNVNHGITIGISYLTQGGASRSIDSIEAANFRASRNGVAENYKTEESNGQYIFYIGNSNEYVHGKQIYEVEYDFKNVITAYDENGNLVYGDNDSASSQQLYWDTNGTDTTVAINNLSAYVHIPSNLAKNITGGTSCYVGSYGSNNTTRCTISSDDETTYNPSAANSNPNQSAETVLSFTTSALKPSENLSFDIVFQNHTFTIPAPTRDFLLVFITVAVIAICILIIALFTRSFAKHGLPKKRYYKGLFLAPQYQAPKEYCVAEAGELLIKPGKNSYVATLLELAVSGKISIVKGEPTKILKKETWSIKVNNLDKITDSQKDMLSIIAGGGLPKAGDTIEIKTRPATQKLAKLSQKYLTDSGAFLKDNKYLIQGRKTKEESSVLLLTFGILFFVLISNLTAIIPIFQGSSHAGKIYIGSNFLPATIITSVIVTIIICSIIAHTNGKYRYYTEKGLDAANYLEGLRLYISMAEADRLEFLQSVKGADTSKKGIVKLYEKLLPYACLFGLEKSWLNELGRYCQEINYSPNWYAGDDIATFYALSAMTRSFSSAVASSTHYVSSSSGSSSSGSSGSFGGGFSGGGGGGGGHGGW